MPRPSYLADGGFEYHEAPPQFQFARDPYEDLPEEIDRAAKSGISTTTAGDAGIGAIKGAEWGAGIGVLAAVASLAIPGVGLVVGGGALAYAVGAALATAGAGAIAGGVTGFLKDQGVEDHIAASYSDEVRNGGALVAVEYPSGPVGEYQIREILEKYGAAIHVRTEPGYTSQPYVS
jgi:hypothetical protein